MYDITIGFLRHTRQYKDKIRGREKIKSVIKSLKFEYNLQKNKLDEQAKQEYNLTIAALGG